LADVHVTLFFNKNKNCAYIGICVGLQLINDNKKIRIKAIVVMANLNLSQADKESIINRAKSLIKLADSSGYTPTSGPNKTDIKQAAKQIIVMLSKQNTEFNQEEIKTILDSCRVIKGRVYGAEVYKRNHQDIMSTTAAMFQDVKKIEDAISFSLEHAKKVAIEAKRQAEIVELEAIRAEQQRKAEEAAKEAAVSKFIVGVGEQIRQLPKALILKQISKIEQAKKSSQQEFLKQYPDALSDERVHKALMSYDEKLSEAKDRVQAAIIDRDKAAEALLAAKIKEENITVAIKNFEQKVQEGIVTLADPNTDIGVLDAGIQALHKGLPDTLLSDAQKRATKGVLDVWKSATVEARERVIAADGAITKFEANSVAVIEKLKNPQETFDAATIKAWEDELEAFQEKLPKQLSNNQQGQVAKILEGFSREKATVESRVKAANDLFKQIKSEVEVGIEKGRDAETPYTEIENLKQRIGELKQEIEHKLLNITQKETATGLCDAFDRAVAIREEEINAKIKDFQDKAEEGIGKLENPNDTPTLESIRHFDDGINLLKSNLPKLDTLSEQQRQKIMVISGEWDTKVGVARSRVEVANVAVGSFEQSVNGGIAALADPNTDIEDLDKKIQALHKSLPAILLSDAQKGVAKGFLDGWDSVKAAAKLRVAAANELFEQIKSEVSISTGIVGETDAGFFAVEYQKDKIKVLADKVKDLNPAQQQEADQIFKKFNDAVAAKASASKDLLSKISTAVSAGTAIVNGAETTHTDIEAQKAAINLLRTEATAFKAFSSEQQGIVDNKFKAFDEAVTAKATASHDLVEEIKANVQLGIAKVNDQATTHEEITSQQVIIDLLRAKANKFKAVTPEQQKAVDNSFKAFDKAVKDKNKAAAVFLSYIRGKIDGLTADIGKTNIKFEDIKPIKEQIEKLKEEEVAFKSLNSDQKAAIKELFTILDEKVKGIELKIAVAETAANAAVAAYKASVESKITVLEDPNKPCDTATIKQFVQEINSLSLPEKLSDTQIATVKGISSQCEAAVQAATDRVKAGDAVVVAFMAQVDEGVSKIKDKDNPISIQDIETLSTNILQSKTDALATNLNDAQKRLIEAYGKTFDDAKEEILSKANEDFTKFKEKVASSAASLEEKGKSLNDLEYLELRVTKHAAILPNNLLTGAQNKEVTDLVKQFKTAVSVAKFKVEVNNGIASLKEQMEARTLTVEEINKINEQIVESKSNLLFKETLNSEQKEEIDEHWKRFDKELEIAKKKVAKDKASLETAATIELGGVDKAPLPPPPPPAKLSVLSSLSNALSEVDSAKSIVKYDTENQDWNAATFNKENVVALFNEKDLKLTVADLAFSSPKKMQFLADDKGDLNPNHISATVLVLQEVSKSNQLQAEGSKNRDLPITLRNFEDKALLEVLTDFNKQLFSNHEVATKDLRSIRINYVGENEELQKLVDAHNAIHDCLLSGKETIDSDLKQKFEQQKNKISQSITTPGKDDVTAQDVPKVVSSSHTIP
jgi:hypothetical protein